MLRLQVEWGADEALLDLPQRRLGARAAAAPAPRVAPGIVHSPAPATPVAADAAALAAGCASLDALRAAMAGFAGCALRDTATQLVFADGAADARVMLIGEAPGADEDRAGRPFVGASGQLLDRMLGSIGLDRTKLRIVNVVPWRPPGNRAPTDSEIAICLPFLHRQIALIRPDFLVLLGATAMKAMIEPRIAAAGIRRNRGSWRQLEIPGIDTPIPTLLTYHPAYLLRTASAKKEAWLDLLALREALETGHTHEKVS